MIFLACYQKWKDTELLGYLLTDNSETDENQIRTASAFV